MSDETKIPPALSAEEWREREARFGHGEHRIYIGHRGGLAEDDPFVRIEEWYEVEGAMQRRQMVVLNGAALPKAIAACNDRLPDDDPRKITRDDVAFLRKAAAWMWSEFGFNDGDAGPLDRIAAKLAALLPPEPPESTVTLDRGGLSALSPDEEQRLRDSL